MRCHGGRHRCAWAQKSALSGPVHRCCSHTYISTKRLPCPELATTEVVVVLSFGAGDVRHEPRCGALEQHARPVGACPAQGVQPPGQAECDHGFRKFDVAKGCANFRRML